VRQAGPSNHVQGRQHRRGRETRAPAARVGAGSRRVGGRPAKPANFCEQICAKRLLTVCSAQKFRAVRTPRAVRKRFKADRHYSAVFADASRLKTGQSVRVAGMRVGTVNSVRLQRDKTVLVTFDADPSVRLTTGTRAAVRYLNLVGDRYLELIDGPGDTVLPPGSQIPKDRTQSALDLDLLLGGLKPVIRGLNPQDVNTLSASRIQVFQGQGRRAAVPVLQHLGVDDGLGRTQPDHPGADRQSADTA